MPTIGYSVCEDYTSQLCSSSDNDYNPNTIYSATCYEVYVDGTTEAEATEACDASCYMFESDFTADGVDDFVCYCSNLSSLDECPLTDYDVTYEYNCASAASDWEYTDSATACADSSTESELAAYASVCCTSGESICEAGYCYSSSSTVSKLAVTAEGSRQMVQVPVSQVEVGDQILSIKSDKKNSKKPKFAEIEKISKSPSSGEFYEIEMAQSTQGKARVTPHHTFPTCNKKKEHLISALDMKEGDCLLDSNGEEQLVKSISKHASVAEEFTYSLQMKEADVIFIGDIATHSQHSHHELPKSKSSTSHNKNMVKTESLLNQGQMAAHSKALRGAMKNHKVSKKKLLEDQFHKLMTSKKTEKMNEHAKFLRAISSK